MINTKIKKSTVGSDTIAFNDRVVSFPQMGNYGYALKGLLGLFGKKVILPPPITKKTIEIGAKYSPEGVCVPFKYNLGTYIELLELGANYLIQAGAGCRYGYYGEVQKKILKDLGYNVQFITLTQMFNLIGIYKKLKKENTSLTVLTFSQALGLVLKKMSAIDAVENICRKNIGFEIEKGEMEKQFRIFLAELNRATSFSQVSVVKKKYVRIMNEIPVNKPENPLRVGVVGEVYVLMEPFTNFYLEKILGNMGVEIHRSVDATNVFWEALQWKKHIKIKLKEAAPYLRYELGAHGTNSVAESLTLMKQGFDGIIHIKPFGCLPEINAMPILSKVSQDYHCPVVYFSFDSQTSENGIKTRLEAFYDMLVFKRKKLGEGVKRSNKYL